MATEREIPEQVQKAIGDLLEAQFNLGLLAATVKRPTRQQCEPAADALSAVCNAIKTALKAAEARDHRLCGDVT